MATQEQIQNRLNTSGFTQDQLDQTSINGQPILKRATPTISVDSLQAPQKPLTLSQPPQSTEPAPISLTPLIEQLQGALAPDPRQAQKDQQAAALQAFTGNAPSRQDVFNQAQQAQGVDTKRQTLQNLLTKSQTLQAQSDNVRGQVTDQFKGTDALQGFVDARTQGIVRQIQREKRLLAPDIAAAQGDFNSAVELAKQAVDFEFADRTDKVNATRTYLKDIQDSIDRGDIKRNKRLDLALAERTRLLNKEEKKIEAEKAEKKAIAELSLQARQQGATDEVVRAIQNAKTREDAIVAGGDFLIDKKAQLQEKLLGEQIKTQRFNRFNKQQQNAFDNLVVKAKLGDANSLKQLGIVVPQSDKVAVSQRESARLNKELASSDTYKAFTNAEGSWRALNEYEKLVKEQGISNPVIDPIEANKAEAVWNSAMLNLKEYYNLGVLNGPDLEIIAGVLPSSVKGAVATGASLVPIVGLVAGPAGDYIRRQQVEAGIKNQKVQFEDKLDNDYLSIRSQYGQYNETQVTNLQDIDRRYVQMKASMQPKIAELVAENPDLSMSDLAQIINNRL